MSLLDPIRPYLWALKWVAIAGILVAAYLVGRGDGRDAQRRTDAALIAKKDAALTQASAALRGASVALQQVSENTRLEKAKADEWMRAGQELSKQATKDAQTYQERLKAIQRELDESGQDPACMAKMKEQVCAILR